MKIMALRSFCGSVTMGIGEIKDVSELTAVSLIAAGYAAEVTETVTAEKPEETAEAIKGAETSGETTEAAAPGTVGAVTAAEMFRTATAAAEETAENGTPEAEAGTPSLSAAEEAEKTVKTAKTTKKGGKK